jgi:hypothetical protein
MSGRGERFRDKDAAGGPENGQSHSGEPIGVNDAISLITGSVTAHNMPNNPEKYMPNN